MVGIDVSCLSSFQIKFPQILAWHFSGKCLTPETQVWICLKDHDDNEQVDSQGLADESIGQKWTNHRVSKPNLWWYSLIIYPIFRQTLTYKTGTPKTAKLQLKYGLFAEYISSEQVLNTNTTGGATIRNPSGTYPCAACIVHDRSPAPLPATSGAQHRRLHSPVLRGRPVRGWLWPSGPGRSTVVLRWNFYGIYVVLSCFLLGLVTSWLRWSEQWRWWHTSVWSIL